MRNLASDQVSFPILLNGFASLLSRTTAQGSEVRLKPDGSKGGSLLENANTFPVKVAEKALTVVGHPLPRVDAPEKVKGAARYVDDLSFSGMLYGGAVRSPHPRARIKKIILSRALSVPGVVTAMIAGDIPGKNLIPLIQQDQPMLAEKIVNHIGEAIILLAAEARASLQEAIQRVVVEYEPLPPVLTIEEGYRRGEVISHWKITRGDVEEGLAASSLVTEEIYRTPYQEHAYLETNGMVAVPDGLGGIVVYGSLQCPFYVQNAVSAVLGLPLHKIRIVQMATGGGFGGKEDAPSLPAAMTALLSLKTGRPVKMIFSREEDMMVMSKRHPAKIRYKAGVNGEGKLAAVEIDYFLDAGAYATLSPVVLWRGALHAAGPYRIPNVKINAYAVRTNKIPSGAFRGFGEPQVAFACESHMDILAHALSMDPLEFRMKNALEPGDETITGHKVTVSHGLREVMQKVAESSEWSAKDQRGGRDFIPDQSRPWLRRGVGFSALYYGVGLGARGRFLNPAGASVVIAPDGSVTIAVGTTEIGQGMYTVLSQIAAEELGCNISRVRFVEPDTSRVPDSGPTVASRTTIMSGNAIRDACMKIKEQMRDALSGHLSGHLSGLPITLPFEEAVKYCRERQVHLSAQGWAVPPPTTFNEEKGQGDAYITYTWSANAVELEVDTLTGEVRVLRVVSGHDVGKIINPQTGEGQIEGGVVQGLGYALVEEHLLDHGRILNDQFSTYIIPVSPDIPEIIPIIVEHPYPWGPYGAKGLGETPIIGIAPAVTNAIFHATGVRLLEIPATPERIWTALGAPPASEKAQQMRGQ